MKKNIRNLLLGSLGLTFFVGCDVQKVKLVEYDFLNTKVGTIKNNQLIVKKIEKPKPIVKKIEKPKPKKKPKVVNISVQEKKKRFKDTLVPIITEVYNDLQHQYLSTKEDIQNNTNQEKIERLKNFFELKTDDNLLHSLKPHPISIVLAQAAIESAWLTSRFTKEANNIFGVWSFNKNEPRIAASGLRGDKTIYLKKYPTIKDAVKDYYKNLGRNWAYKEFRRQRTLTNDPHELVLHLKSYSEKKEEYTKMLQKVISYNKFDIYDINGSF